MHRYVEVIHVVDGRVFDEECYECAAVPRSVLDRPAGFYAVFWPSDAASHRFDSGETFVGPFATAQQAESVTKGGPS